MLYSVLFRFGHIRRWDKCAVYILYSKISTDPGLLKIRHSHRFVAVVIQFLIIYELTCFFHHVRIYVFGNNLILDQAQLTNYLLSRDRR